MNILFDVAIIGGGAAGLAVAANLSRANKSIIIIEKETLGGRLINDLKITGCPDFKNKTESAVLKTLTNQINKDGVTVYYDEAILVNYKRGIYIVSTKNTKETICARNLICATGRSIPDTTIEYASATLPVNKTDLKGKRVLIIGDSPKCSQMAQKLAKTCNHVFVSSAHTDIAHMEELLTLSTTTKNISCLPNCNITKVCLGNDAARYSAIFDTYAVVPCDYIIMPDAVKSDVGYLKFFATPDKGLFDTNDYQIMNIPGLYAVGDCCKNAILDTGWALKEGKKLAEKLNKIIV